jgi:hypothetical protein
MQQQQHLGGRERGNFIANGAYTMLITPIKDELPDSGFAFSLPVSVCWL